MSSVDDRIVNMQFNNKQFTQGVTESQRSLSGLEKSLASTAKTKGLEGLANGVDGVKTKFSAMQIAGVAAVATIATKATSMGLNFLKSFTFGPVMDGFREYQTNLESIQTVMANTGKDVNTVNGYMNKLNKFSDLTIYNFSEMAKNIGTFTAAGVDLKTSTASIQGIANMAALSGSTSQQASTAMYQLSQAISAGKVGLQDWNSVVNAGMGGKNLQNALIATGQAMGTIGKNAVSTSGKMKNLKIDGESFRESISAGPGKQSWLSSDVLTQTLALMDGRLSKAAMKMKGLNEEQIKGRIETQKRKLVEEGYSKSQIKSLMKTADAAFKSATTIKTLPQLIGVVKESLGSTWSQVFQGVLGNFNQSKRLWTNVGNAIQTQTNKFGNALVGPNGHGGMIGTWAKAGGRKELIMGFKNTFGALGDILGTVKKAFRDIFPPTMGNTLIALSRGFASFAAMLRPSAETLDYLRSIFGGIFAVLHIGITLVKGVASAFIAFFGAVFKSSGNASGGILKMVATVGDVLIAFDKWLTAGGKLSDMMAGVGKIAGMFVAPIVAGIGLIIKGFANLAFAPAVGAVMFIFGELKNGMEALGGLAKSALAPMAGPFKKVQGYAQGLLDKMHDVKGSATALSGPMNDAMNAFGGKLQVVGSQIADTFNELKGPVIGAVGGVLADVGDKISDIFNKLKGPALSATADALSSVGDTVADIFTKLKSTVVDGGLPGAMDALKSAGSGIASMFGSLKGLIAGAGLGDIFAGFSADGVVGGIRAAIGSFKEIEGAIQKVKSSMGSATGVIKGFFGMLGGGAASSAASANDKVGDAATGAAEKTKSTWETVSGILSTVGAGMKATFHVIGTAVGWLSDQLSGLFGGDKDALDWATLFNALFTGALLMSIKGFMDSAGGMFDGFGDLVVGIKDSFGQLTSTLKTMQQSVQAKLIKSIAIAVGILAVSVLLLSLVDIETLGVSLGAMATMMGMLVGSMALLAKIGGGGVKITMLATSMVMMSGAMINLALAVAIFGRQDPKKVATGIGMMAASIGVLMGAMLGFSKIRGSVEGFAGSLLIMSIAMNVLAGAVQLFGMMKPEVLEQGLGAMAIALGELTLVLLAFSKTGTGTEKAAGAILVMSAAMVIMSGAIAALGAIPIDNLQQGLAGMALALGMMTLSLMLVSANAQQAAIGAAAILMIAGAMGILVPIIITLGTVPWQIVAAGLGFLAAGLLILIGAGALAAFVAPGLLVLAGSILLLGVAVALAGTGMLAFATGFALMAAVGAAGVAVLVLGFQAFMALLPSFAVQIASAFVSFVQTIAAASPKLRAAFGTIFKSLIGVIKDAIPVLGDLFSTLIATGLRIIRRAVPDFIETGFTIIDAFLDSVEKHVPSIVDSAVGIITGFMDAIGRNAKKITNSAADMVINFINGVADTIRTRSSDLRTAGLNLAGSLIDGMTGGLASKGMEAVRAAVNKLADAIPGWAKKMLKINSPSKRMIPIGEGVGEGTAVGIDNSTRTVMNSVKNLGDTIGTGMGTTAARAIKKTVAQVVAETVAMANAIVAAGDKSVLALQNRASSKQGGAYAADAKADLLEQAAKKINGKKHPAKRKAADTAATNARSAADRAQSAADAAAQAVADRQTFLNADLTGKGDILSKTAEDQAGKAQQLLAKSNAEAAKARTLKAAARRAMLNHAAADARAAAAMAGYAKTTSANAAKMYQADIDADAKKIADQIDTNEKNRKWQDTYDKADSKTQADMLDARAAAAEKTAADAKKHALDLIAQAKKDAKTNHAKSEQELTDAQAAADASEAAASAADQDRKQAEQLRNQQSADPSGTGAGGSAIVPSRSALEDAASAVDRYSASLTMAEEAAMASQPVVQFNQTNYSPESLSESTVYRNTKNLLAAQEVKMGAST